MTSSFESHFVLLTIMIIITCSSAVRCQQLQPTTAAGSLPTMSLRITLQFDTPAVALTSLTAAMLASPADIETFAYSLSFDFTLLSRQLNANGASSGSTTPPPLAPNSSIFVLVPPSYVRNGNQGSISANAHFYLPSASPLLQVSVKAKLDSLAALGAYKKCNSSEVKRSCDFADMVRLRLTSNSSTGVGVQVRILSIGSADTSANGGGGGSGASSPSSSGGGGGAACFIEQNCGVSYFVIALVVISFLICLRLCLKCVCEVGIDQADKAHFDDDHHHASATTTVKANANSDDDVDGNSHNKSQSTNSVAPRQRPTAKMSQSKTVSGDTPRRMLSVPPPPPPPSRQPPAGGASRNKNYDDDDDVATSEGDMDNISRHASPIAGLQARLLKVPSANATSNPAAAKGDKKTGSREGQDYDDDQELSVLKTNPFASPGPAPSKTKTSRSLLQQQQQSAPELSRHGFNEDLDNFFGDYPINAAAKNEGFQFTADL